MGITFTKAFLTADGTAFSTIVAAQKHELNSVLFGSETMPEVIEPEAIIAAIITNGDKIVDILTTTGKSRPRARKSNGAVRKKKSAAPSAQTNITWPDHPKTTPIPRRETDASHKD